VSMHPANFAQSGGLKNKKGHSLKVPFTNIINVIISSLLLLPGIYPARRPCSEPAVAGL
jgi:hypothetical protein